MGFTSTILPLRDTSMWKRQLDYGITSKITSGFVANPQGKILLLEDGLPHMTKLSVSAMARMSVEDLRARLRQNSCCDPDGPAMGDDLFARTDFRGRDGSLILWWGFPIGTMDSPAGLYFLVYYQRPPSESQISALDYPLICQMKERLQKPVAHILVDETDQRILEKCVPYLMEREEASCRHHRVLLSNEITIDGGTKPVLLKFEDIGGSVRMIHDSPLFGDVQFFKKLADGGGRPALLQHTDQRYSYEVMLPMTWHAYILGWVGVPLTSLDSYVKPSQMEIERSVGTMGHLLGKERMSLGLLPQYKNEDGLFEFESFMKMMQAMIDRNPPRPFTLMLLRGKGPHLDGLREILLRSKRSIDILTRTEDEFVLLFPDQEETKRPLIEKRYRDIVERMEPSGESHAVTLFSCASHPKAETSEKLMHELFMSPSVQVTPQGRTDKKHPGETFDDWLKKFQILKNWE